MGEILCICVWKMYRKWIKFMHLYLQIFRIKPGTQHFLVNVQKLRKISILPIFGPNFPVW